MSSTPTTPATDSQEPSRLPTSAPSSPPSDADQATDNVDEDKVEKDEDWMKAQEKEEREELEKKRRTINKAHAKEAKEKAYGLLDELLRQSEIYGQHLESRRAANSDKTHKQPKTMTGGTLREYQIEGFNWLVNLYMNGINGILADEMGLGKTLQTIALLATLKSQGCKGPFLIVAPLSTLSNWIAEFEHWTPSLKVCMYHGTKDERNVILEEELSNFGRPLNRATQKKGRKVAGNKGRKSQKFNSDVATEPDFPIVCTTFEIAMKDRNELSRAGKWTYMVIDEGHRLKSYSCKLIQELTRITCENKLLLTGTPLQNNLAELWSLMHFLEPDTFRDLDAFQSWFAASELQDTDGRNQILHAERERSIIAKLQAVLRPYVLRRVKSDVESDLPPKREYILFAPTTTVQDEMLCAIDEHRLREHVTKKAFEFIEKKHGKENTPRSAKRKAAADLSEPATKSHKSSRESTPGKGTATPKSGTSTPNKKHGPVINGSPLVTRLRNSKAEKRYKEFGEGEKLYRENIPEESEPEEELDEEEKEKKTAVRYIAEKKTNNDQMQRRLVCNSPEIFYWPFGDGPPDETLVTRSGKLLVLDRLVSALLEKGHKILIFSQFTMTLDILEEWAVALRGYETCRFDGGTQQTVRKSEIERFNKKGKDSANIFLLATRAGGQGINLVAADTVILFDSDFNPQQDLQAQDRVHRIGQTRPVLIFRLATHSQVEEDLLRKADGKRLLERLVMRDGKFRPGARKSAPDDDMREMERIFREQAAERAKHKRLSAGEVLSDKDLNIMLDRSKEAYERAAKGEGESGDAFELFDVKEQDEGGLLKDLGKAS